MKLTTRDFEILEFLAAQGAASSRQLMERFFQTRGSCDKRLHFLKTVGLVEACPIAGLESEMKTSPSQLREILGVGNSDLWKYRIYRLGPKFKNRRLGAEQISDAKMWKHQVLLNRVRALCEELFPGSHILTDPEIRQEAMRLGSSQDQLIPDLVIRLSGREIAVELERTLKSSRIYFERFQAYRNSIYTHVVYFCETDLIFRKVSDLAANFKKIAVTGFLSRKTIFRERFGFQPIQTFLDSMP